MNITILVDDENSWFIPYAKDLKKQLEDRQNHVSLIHNAMSADGGDICFLLSCSKIVAKNILEKYMHNIVVHASGSGAIVGGMVGDAMDTTTVYVYDCVANVHHNSTSQGQSLVGIVYGCTWGLTSTI